MVKIAVIGLCGHSTFLSADHFHRKGETLIAHSVAEEIGGKGFNQAIAARRMQAEVSFLAAVGYDAHGQQCRVILERNEVKPFLKIKEDKPTTFAFILTDKAGQNQVTEYIGAELDEKDVYSFEEEIKTADILLLQHEVPTAVNALAVALAEKHGVKVILNPAPIAPIPESIQKGVFLVTPNEQEREAICISEFQNVVTTLGDKGCSVNDEVQIAGMDVKAVDTTGAGDTFNGVLAVCIAEGKGLLEACQYAVCASGISVTKNYVVDSIPEREEIEKMLAMHFPKK